MSSDHPRQVSVAVRFDRLGLQTPTAKLNRPDGIPEGIVRTVTHIDDGGTILGHGAMLEVAATVSAAARTVVPGLEGHRFRVRLTTPTGGGWAQAYVLLDSPDIKGRRRYGHGLVTVTDVGTDRRLLLTPTTHTESETTP